MTHVEYFKNQAKKLHKDWKLRKQKLFVFNIRELFRLYNVKVTEEPTLMKAQHLLACSLGRKSWSELINDTEENLAYTRSVLTEETQLFMKSQKQLEKMKDSATQEDSSEYKGEVECLHCGRRFFANKPNHLPSCDGEAWDIIPTEKL